MMHTHGEVLKVTKVRKTQEGGVDIQTTKRIDGHEQKEEIVNIIDKSTWNQTN